MTTIVPIGEFSRLTHLTVKTLRHYHDIGLLDPHEVDDATGYRRYTTEQVPAALLIGRLRALEMPLPDVRRVLGAADPAARDAAIAEHLSRMERELDRTRRIVGSLRGLLRPAPDLTVHYRTIAAQPAVAVSATVDRADIGTFCDTAYTRLYRELGRRGVAPAGPGAGTYDDAFFTEGSGGVTTYVPVGSEVGPAGGTAADGVELVIIPGGRYAVAEHVGAFTELDRTYAALGSHVARHDVVVPGPIREIYRIGPTEVTDPADYRSDVCWPVAG